MESRGFTRFSWGVFGYALAVILWGYFLRISESGDGCGEDWPLCRAAAAPATPEFSTLVELTHRLSSGLVLILAIAMAVWAFRAFPRGSAVRWGAGAALLFTITESLFGAVVVVFGWVAGDISTGRILIRPFHVTNTFLLLAAFALTAFWATRSASRLPPLRSPAGKRVLLGGLGALALAWTGAWTGLAATAFSATSIREGLEQYLDPEHLLVSLRLLHPALAVVVFVLLWRIARYLRARCADPWIRPLATAVVILAGAQLIFGPITILLGNPVWARLVHLFIADALWVALLFAGATALDPRAESTPGTRVT